MTLSSVVTNPQEDNPSPHLKKGGRAVTSSLVFTHSPEDNNQNRRKYGSVVILSFVSTDPPEDKTKTDINVEAWRPYASFLPVRWRIETKQNIHEEVW